MIDEEFYRLRSEYLAKRPEISILDVPCLSCGAWIEQLCGKYSRYVIQVPDERHKSMPQEVFGRTYEGNRFVHVHKTRVAVWRDINERRETTDVALYVSSLRYGMEVATTDTHIRLLKDHRDTHEKKWGRK